MQTVWNALSHIAKESERYCRFDLIPERNDTFGRHWTVDRGSIRENHKQAPARGLARSTYYIEYGRQPDIDTVLRGWTVVLVTNGIDDNGYPYVELWVGKGDNRKTVRFTADGYTVTGIEVSEVHA